MAAVKAKSSSDRLNMVLPIECLGMKVLHEPHIDEIDLDIIAVHGIAADPRTSWVHTDTNVNWLQHPEMLPKAVPRARILTFNYNSVWFGVDATKQSLHDVATGMLDALERYREDCISRPIIFIGHCFGGLVLQQASALAMLHPADHPELLGSIRGFIFLGTPHSGVEDASGMSTSGDIYAAIVESKVLREENVLHSVMPDNDTLVSTVKIFSNSIRQLEPRPKIHCFFEQKSTNVGAIVGMKTERTFVVNRSSGSLDGHPSTPLSLDHFRINKFKSPDDPGYEVVSYRIEKMAKGIAEIELARTQVVSARSASLIPDLAAPIGKEENFVTRDGVLDKIEALFAKNVKVALCGKSGTGKTHVAVEYAHKWFQEHPSTKVHWVDANSAEFFEYSFKRIAQNLHLYMGERRTTAVVQSVHDHLKQDPTHWLMVIDGLDSEDDLKATDPEFKDKSLLDFIPDGYAARILFTTRSKPLASRLVGTHTKYIVDINPIKNDDACFLLLGKHTKDASKMKLINSLASRLDGLAGAMSMVLAYWKVNGKGANLKEYKQFLSDSSASRDKYVDAVWKLQHELLVANHQASEDFMLQLCALDVQTVPRALFLRGEVNEHVPILEEYGIVEPSKDRPILRVAPLFRKCARTWLAKNPEKKASTEEMLIAAVGKCFTDHARESMLPCALAVLTFKPASAQAKREAADLRLKVSAYYVQVRQFKKAKTHAEKCLKLRQAEPDSEKKAAAVKDAEDALANIKDFITQAKGEKPKKDASRGLQEADEQLKALQKTDEGWKNRETVRQVSQLAARKLYHGQQDGSNNSVALYKRIFDWAKNDADPLERVRHQYNLALAEDAAEHDDEAQKHYESALQLIEEQPENSLELLSLYLKIKGSLACLFCAQDQFEKAEEIFKFTFPMQIKVLGVDHPDTLVTRYNIALLRQERGEDLEQVGLELHRVLTRQVHTLEPGDPAMLRTACSLGTNWRLAGRHEEARGVFEGVLRAQKKNLGSDHRDTRSTKMLLEKLP